MPMSSDPDARARSMRNLKPATGTRPGEQRALKNGSRAKGQVGDVAQARLDLTEALSEAVPLRDSDGNLSKHDRLAVEVVAAALARFRYMTDNFERICERGGKLRYTLARELRRSEKQLIAELHELGCTPRGRAALGLDIAQAGAIVKVSQPNRDPEHLKGVARALYGAGALPRLTEADVIDTNDEEGTA